MNEKILLAGATGYLGRYLARELKSKGYWVRILIRDEKQKQLFKEIDDYYVGQITDPSTLINVADGIDRIISTIGITRQKEGLSYMDVDYKGNANLLAEAQKSNVKSFQYISAINGDQMTDLKIFQAKERFVSELKLSNMNYTIIRPNGFFSDMADFLKMAKGGKVYLFGDGNLKLNPIAGEDLAAYCVMQLELEKQELSIGGPEIFTQNQLAEMALLTWNRKGKIIHLPDWIRKATIGIFRIFTRPQTYGPIEFFLTAMGRENIAPTYGEIHLKDFFQTEIGNL
jgi:uncharacterized protein YbjT (DUF2867 family)